MKKLNFLIFLILVLFTISSCEEEIPMTTGTPIEDVDYSPTNFAPEYPATFPELEIPADNELTMEKIVLGQHLFYDAILSADSTMSCSSCHDPKLAFTDASDVSFGIDGISGPRSSMSLVNVGFFYNGLFWDGRDTTLEAQALLPVEDPVELHNDWPNVMNKLRNHDDYPRMFREAFGISFKEEMTKEMAAKALASFQRVLISGNSRFDRWLLNLDVLSDEELNGYEMYFDKEDALDAHCAHCHESPLMSTNDYFNNAITAVDTVSDFPDLGRFEVTSNPLDKGKFRAPSLRNITLTAPYMHDGRFKTLREVLEHYNSGGKFSPNSDAFVLPLGLNEEQLQNLEAFLHTLVDTSYLNKEYVINPFD